MPWEVQTILYQGSILGSRTHYLSVYFPLSQREAGLDAAQVSFGSGIQPAWKLSNYKKHLISGFLLKGQAKCYGQHILKCLRGNYLMVFIGQSL